MLKQVAREHKVFIHCFHISGDRTIASGVDGLSWGNYDAGISLGIYACQFMQLNVFAWDVVGKVLADWCKSWMEEDYTPQLSPVEWFVLEQSPKGTYVTYPYLGFPYDRVLRHRYT
jgi:hypothetical protein